MISLAEYNRLEQDAIQRSPNRLVAAVRPVVFDRISYPTRINDISEIRKYVDVMHEGRFEKDFKELLGGSLTTAEWNTWKQIYNWTVSIVGTIPRGSLVRAQYAFRKIISLFDAPRTIVEIGPGSGYLTVLLRQYGYSVQAIEVSQAFWLWQSRLFACCPEYYAPFPWWDFYKIDPASIYMKQIDLVVANHCILEMTSDAANYIARCCEAWKCPIFSEGMGLVSKDNTVDPKKIFANVPAIFLDGPLPSEDGTIELDEILKYQQNFSEDLRTNDEKWLETLYGKGYYS